MLRLYDTATREVRELALREPGSVSIYLCGPTVYGPPHIGHGRATLVYDVLRRYLQWSGLQVRLVSNITDIDDSIINRANAENRPWQEITSKCEAVWFEAMGKINVARPTDVPHATDYVVQMVAMIGQLVDMGKAYLTDDGVYLSVQTVPGYGLLVHQSLADMLAGVAIASWSVPATSGILPTSCCGSSPSPASRRGRHRGVRAGQAGTASAW